MLGTSSFKLRREQLERNHQENQTMAKEGKTDQTSKAQPWEKEKRPVGYLGQIALRS
jgi:hypothetical protein